MNKSTSLPLPRIGIIRIINTIIGISIALEKYNLLHTGHLSSHLVENFFGTLRIACNYELSGKKTIITSSIVARGTMNWRIEAKPFGLMHAWHEHPWPFLDTEYGVMSPS